MSTYYNATYLSTESTIARSDISHLAPAPLQNRSYSYEAPEWNRESEGLQINPNGPHPFPSTKAIDSTSKHSLPWLRSIASTQKQLAVGQEGLIPADEATNHDRTCTLKRRTFIIILSICVLIVICAAVGGAVGGYYGTRSSHPYVPLPPRRTQHPSLPPPHALTLPQPNPHRHRLPRHHVYPPPPNPLPRRTRLHRHGPPPLRHRDRLPRLRPPSHPPRLRQPLPIARRRPLLLRHHLPPGHPRVGRQGPQRHRHAGRLHDVQLYGVHGSVLRGGRVHGRRV